MNDITFNLSSDEVQPPFLRIAPDGFYIRGEKVPVDDKEAMAVYNAFQQWLAWAHLQRQ